MRRSKPGIRPDPKDRCPSCGADARDLFWIRRLYQWGCQKCGATFDTPETAKRE